MHSSMKFMLLSVFLDYSCSNSTCNLPLFFLFAEIDKRRNQHDDGRNEEEQAQGPRHEDVQAAVAHDQ